jgi:hypothetical protein
MLLSDLHVKRGDIDNGGMAATFEMASMFKSASTQPIDCGL